jgi:hypothetical protein
LGQDFLPRGFSTSHDQKKPVLQLEFCTAGGSHLSAPRRELAEVFASSRCFCSAARHSSRPGENVLDLFGGSGSTLIAAEQTGLTAFVQVPP